MIISCSDNKTASDASTPRFIGSATSSFSAKLAILRSCHFLQSSSVSGRLARHFKIARSIVALDFSLSLPYNVARSTPKSNLKKLYLT